MVFDEIFGKSIIENACLQKFSILLLWCRIKLNLLLLFFFLFWGKIQCISTFILCSVDSIQTLLILPQFQMFEAVEKINDCVES